MAHQHHDDRRDRQRQQHPGKAEQLATGQNREDDRHRMQADTIAHQQWGEDHTFKHLPDHEHRRDTDEVGWIEAELEQPGDHGSTDTDDKAHVRDNGRQAGNHTDQEAQLQAHQHQAGGIDDAQCHHHQQLAADKRAQHLVAFPGKLYHLGLTVARQQATDLGHHYVPIPQQVETHHWDQHQVGQPADQCQGRSSSLGQYDADDVAGLTHVLGDSRLDLVELPEAIAQAHMGLDPGQGFLLQPVEHLRGQLVQADQLLGKHRHQHRQQHDDDQREEAEDKDHAQGARELELFKPINQRIPHVGQQDRDQKRREDRVQQVDEGAQQQHCT